MEGREGVRWTRECGLEVLLVFVVRSYAGSVDGGLCLCAPVGLAVFVFCRRRLLAISFYQIAIAIVDCRVSLLFVYSKESIAPSLS